MSTPPLTPEPAAADDGVDPAFASLLADPRMALRPCPPHLPLAELRRAANRFLAAAPGPAIHRVETLAAPGPAGAIALRLYRPSAKARLPLIVFAHGGGFILGDLGSHDAMCRRLAIGADALVAAIDYRLAPEAPFPAALDDIVAALCWLIDAAEPLGIDAGRIALAGDSAGAQLAAATALAPLPIAPYRHLALFYPLIDPAADTPSSHAFAEGYMLTRSFIGWAWDCYAATPHARRDPRVDLTRADLRGLPPTTIVTASHDPLRDEGEAFAARLAVAGADVAVKRYEGMIHGFAGLPQFTPVAESATGFVARRLREALAR